ncbi:MAG: hypothetical protein OXP12_00125 [Thaumarchaeota archaeon]|nr:hypothetical protein [Nitrososphaerota archaeon]MDE0266901.1 hypothetical protein [Nitrososphaerota archaeon]MDE0526698.1 hypothetical protein [Nitrososphaerota archaeon]
MDLFLDIETAPDMTASEYADADWRMVQGALTKQSDPDTYWKARKGALNAADGKVILIAYQLGEHGPVRRLAEWESDERTILAEFYGVLSRFQRIRGFRIIGHNLTRFDLPFLYARMLHHNIDGEREIYRRLVEGVVVCDTLQMHLPLNGFDISGLRHDTLMHAYGLPVKETSGGDEIRHYFGGEYGKILEYSKREFRYAELFARMKDGGMVSAERLKGAMGEMEGRRRQQSVGGAGPQDADGGPCA